MLESPALTEVCPGTAARKYNDDVHQLEARRAFSHTSLLMDSRLPVRPRACSLQVRMRGARSAPEARAAAT